jgi:hypothetical protein
MKNEEEDKNVLLFKWNKIAIFNNYSLIANKLKNVISAGVGSNLQGKNIF